MKSAAEDDGEPRAQLGNFLESRGGGLGRGVGRNLHGFDSARMRATAKELFLGGKRLDVPLDARRGFDELFVARRKARAAKTFAVFAERRARNHCDFFRLQQTDGEIFFAQAGF